MKALVSGQAGLAVLFDGDHVSSLHYDPEETVPRTNTDIPYLLAYATDVMELLDVTREAAVEALDLACRKDESLHLFLILLDGAADKEARHMAAECLEETLGDPGVFNFIGNRLYAAPLPEVSDLVGALIYADRVGSSRLANFLDELGSYQSDIRRWRAAWDSLPLELFARANTKEELGHLLVTSGTFRKFIQSDPEDIDSLLYGCLIDPTFQALPYHRTILTGISFLPLRQLQVYSPLPQSSTSDSPRWSPRLPATLFGSPKPSARLPEPAFSDTSPFLGNNRCRFLVCHSLSYPDGSGSPSIRPSILANSRRVRWLSAKNNQ